MDIEQAKNSTFIRNWVEENVSHLSRLYPQATDDDLRGILYDIVIENISIPRALIYNDYEDDTQIRTDALTLIDWIDKTHPICAGNGTLFKNQHLVKSPIANIIINRQKIRKHYQAEAKKYMDNPDSYEYNYNNDQQLEAKVKINAIYGSFGAKTFQLFNVLTASSVTGTAQSLISATAIGFEAFLANNAKFKSIDEMIFFVTNVLEEEYTVDIHKMDMITDKSVVYNRLISTFLTPDIAAPFNNIINQILNTCTDEELTRLYYKNNLYGFVNSTYIRELLTRIYNKNIPFRNPNVVPEELIDLLNELWSYCNDIVFYNHSFTERINRLVNDLRKSVIIIDTDSNMINIQPWMDTMEKLIYPNMSSTLSKDDTMFESVNILAFLITQMIKKLLLNYCDSCNILPEEAGRVNMKNEFFYSKMLLADVKKRYCARIVLKEGDQFNPPKDDFKGHDFRKAGASEEIESYFKKIVSDCILGDNLDIAGVLSRLSALSDDIRNSLKNGERRYLTRANCKPEVSYDDPESQAAVLAVYVWNTLYPDNQVSVPDKLDMVFVDIPDPSVLVPYEEKYPEETRRIEQDIFNGPYRKVFQEKGIHTIVLPNNGEPIPEFLRPFLDINKVETRNISMFSPILTALSIPMQSGNTTYSYFTNVLDI